MLLPLFLHCCAVAVGLCGEASGVRATLNFVYVRSSLLAAPVAKSVFPDKYVATTMYAPAS